MPRCRQAGPGFVVAVMTRPGGVLPRGSAAGLARIPYHSIQPGIQGGHECAVQFRAGIAWAGIEAPREGLPRSDSPAAARNAARSCCPGAYANPAPPEAARGPAAWPVSGLEQDSLKRLPFSKPAAVCIWLATCRINSTRLETPSLSKIRNI